MTDPTLFDLERILRRLEPLPPEILVVGSFGLALIERRLGGRSRSVRTLDIDIALDGGAGGPVSCQAWLDDAPSRLKASHRLEPRGPVHGEGKFHVLIPRRVGALMIEFLLRRTGGGRRPPRQQGEVRPQVVKNLDLLFLEPWSLELEGGTTLRVPNPLCFVLQKAVIARRGAKGDKDAGDVLRVAEVSVGRPREIQGLYGRIENLGKREAKRVREARRAFEAAYLADDARNIDRAIRALGRSPSRREREAVRSCLRSFHATCAEAPS